MAETTGMCVAALIAPWIGGVQAVDVGQQHELVGLHHLGHARGESIIVTEADLGSRHGVVLVDHRDAAEVSRVFNVARALR